MWDYLYQKAIRRAEKQCRKEKLSNLRNAFGERIEVLDDRDLRYLHHAMEVLKRLDSRPGVIYDIGGFDGASAETFALAADAEVYVFEPLPDMQEAINVRAERDARIHLQPTALGPKKCQQVIRRDAAKVAASSFLGLGESFRNNWPQFGKTEPVEVQVNRLDEWVNDRNLPQPQMIKMDVQGMELDVIHSAPQIFSGADYWWLELNLYEFFEGGSDFDALYHCATGMGFHLVDCIDLVRNKDTGKLLYFDGIFEKKERK